jgi:hypothetical protein
MAVASGYRRACCAAPSSVSLCRAYHQGLTVEPEEISRRHEILRAVLVRRSEDLPCLGLMGARRRFAQRRVAQSGLDWLTQA